MEFVISEISSCDVYWAAVKTTQAWRTACPWSCLELVGDLFKKRRSGIVCLRFYPMKLVSCSKLQLLRNNCYFYHLRQIYLRFELWTIARDLPKDFFKWFVFFFKTEISNHQGHSFDAVSADKNDQSVFASCLHNLGLLAVSGQN